MKDGDNGSMFWNLEGFPGSAVQARRRIAFTILAMVLAAGCSGPAPPPVQPDGPLTVEEWKAMTDMTAKYDPGTFDRLKKGNPKLENEKEWDKFFQTVVAPAHQVDVPKKTYAY